MRPRGMSMRDRYRQSGVTLLELMVVLIIVAIVLAFAVPSYRTLIMNNRQDTAIGDLGTALNLARNTALSRNMPVGVCPVSPPAGAGQAPGNACVASFANGGSGTAWMVYLPSGGGAGTLTVLASYVVPGSDQLTFSSSIQTNGSIGIVFNGRGLATASGLVTVCDARGASYAQAVQVNTAGYIQTSPQRGVGPDGSALTCN